MRNHWKIIRILYSRHLLTEILLAVEIVLVIQLLALATNPFSYVLSQLRASNSCWKNGSYIYFGRTATAQEYLDPKEVLAEYPQIEAFFQCSVTSRSLSSEDDPWKREDGSRPSFTFVEYNDAMLAKLSGLLDVSPDIDPGETIPVCVPISLKEVFPPGTVLTMYDIERKASYTVCGTIRQRQIPVITFAGSLKTVGECLSLNIQEEADHDQIVFICPRGKDNPVMAGMFQLAEGTDVEQTISHLNKRFCNCGEFCTYSSMSDLLTNLKWGLNKSLLLEGLLLLMVVITHFIGYLFISTRNKERTNTLLTINGVSPLRLSVYNVVSVLLLLLPAILIGMLLVPLTEKQYTFGPGGSGYTGLAAYGGHSVLWGCIAIFTLIILVTTFLTVRVRIRKGKTSLLYKQGT